MPTKVTVIGEEKSTKRTIALCHSFSKHNKESDIYYTEIANVPSHIFDNVELISRNYLDGFDLI